MPSNDKLTSDKILFCSTTGTASWSVETTTGIDLLAGCGPGSTGVVRPTLTT